ncbi:MAG TPA: DUF2530 domain-containing protein [Dermatophilaceae bacterium]|nr:DUF2530 domain-containing protein [Dermatophilaceae bacterium]
MPARTHDLPEPPPMRVDTGRVIVAGLLAWLVALVVLLLVPGLREGERSWWPWTCVVAIGGGLAAWGYVRRGRGNAAGS